MIECEGLEFPDELMKKAFDLGQKVIDEACDLQSDFLKTLEIQQKEITFNKPSQATMDFVKALITEEKLQAMAGNTKARISAPKKVAVCPNCWTRCFWRPRCST